MIVDEKGDKMSKEKVNDLSSLNEVDLNFDSDLFIKFSIDGYLIELKNNSIFYNQADTCYLNNFNSTIFKYSSKCDFKKSFDINQVNMIHSARSEYSWGSKYEKTIGFSDYKSFRTYESKPYSHINDNLKKFQWK